MERWVLLGFFDGYPEDGRQLEVLRSVMKLVFVGSRRWPATLSIYRNIGCKFWRWPQQKIAKRWRWRGSHGVDSSCHIWCNFLLVATLISNCKAPGYYRSSSLMSWVCPHMPWQLFQRCKLMSIVLVTWSKPMSGQNSSKPVGGHNRSKPVLGHNSSKPGYGLSCSFSLLNALPECALTRRLFDYCRL